MDADEIRGRKAMRDAFVELSDAALRGGVDQELVHELQGRFFDGNVEIKSAVRTIRTLAREHVEHRDGCGLLAAQLLAALGVEPVDMSR